MSSKYCKGLLLVFGAQALVAAAQTSSAWRYDLKTGDHLVYSYSFQRQAQSDDINSGVEVHFETHMLVAGENANRISLGFQRNRLSAELTQYKVKGKDRLAKERVDFQKRMQARPRRFSEAMEITPAGEPLFSWEMARETSSHILSVLHEVMSLAPPSMKPGEVWHGDESGLDHRWTGDETIHGKICHRVEAIAPAGAIKLTYWWSPDSGVAEKIELDGSYPTFGGASHEIARMELQSRTRGERLDQWLASDKTRQGALQAILLSSQNAVSSEQLTAVLTANDPASQALALAITSRRKTSLPAGMVTSVQQTGSAVAKLLVAEIAHPLDPAPQSECHQPIPAKISISKFGTHLEPVAATPNRPETAYLLRVPLTYRADRPSPLLVYLSGGAGLAIDGVNTAEDVVSNTDYLVLYPQAAGYWWKPEQAQRFDEVLNQVLDRYNVDRDRIYLTGFSNGGTGSLYFAELWPQKFAAVVSQMGAGQCVDQVKAGLTNLENLPLFFIHGENDPIINHECSTTTQSALLDLRPATKPELKILPNREHDITLQTDDGLTLAFFKDKPRNAFPRHIEFTFTDAQAPRSYWIEILDGKPGKSSVEARVKPDNTIEIHSHELSRLRLYLRSELLSRPGDVLIEWNGKKMFSGPLEDICKNSEKTSFADPKLDLTDRKDFSLP